MSENFPPQRQERGFKKGFFMRVLMASKEGADAAPLPLAESDDSIIDGNRGFPALMKTNPSAASEIYRRRQEQARKRLR